MAEDSVDKDTAIRFRQLCAVLHSYLPLADDNSGSVPIPIDD
jgi:hypothetical protein